jgi:hypothetical protein
MLVDALVERIRGRYFQPSSREFNSIEPVEVEILHRGEVSPKLIHGSQNRKDPFLELPMNNVSPSISGNQKSIITPLTTATSMRSDPFIDLI